MENVVNIMIGMEDDDFSGIWKKLLKKKLRNQQN